MTNFTFQLQGRGYRIRGNKNAQWRVGVVSQPKTRAVFGTLPEAARRYGIGLRTLRRAARVGAFPLYSAETTWPRVCFSEVEAWVRSTRIVPTAAVEARVAEVLDREVTRCKK